MRCRRTPGKRQDHNWRHCSRWGMTSRASTGATLRCHCVLHFPIKHSLQARSDQVNSGGRLVSQNLNASTTGTHIHKSSQLVECYLSLTWKLLPPSITRVASLIAPSSLTMDTVSLTEFPRFQDGDVTVVVSVSRTYQLHSSVLRRNSVFFDHLLRVQGPAELCPAAKKSGVTVVYRLELVRSRLAGGTVGEFVITAGTTR